MLNEREPIWKTVIWDKWQLFGIWIADRHWDYAHRLTLTRTQVPQTHRRWDHEDHIGVLISPHVSLLQSSIFVILCVNTPHTFGCSFDDMLHTHARTRSESYSRSFICTWDYNYNLADIDRQARLSSGDHGVQSLGMSEVLCRSRHVLPTTKQQQFITHNTATPQIFKTSTTQQAEASTKNTKMAGNLSTTRKKEKRSTAYLHLFGAQCCTQKSLSP